MGWPDVLDGVTIVFVGMELLCLALRTAIRVARAE
jgi:hypothetical protein